MGLRRIRPDRIFPGLIWLDHRPRYGPLMLSFEFCFLSFLHVTIRNVFSQCSCYGLPKIGIQFLTGQPLHLGSLLNEAIRFFPLSHHRHPSLELIIVVLMKPAPIVPSVQQLPKIAWNRRLKMVPTKWRNQLIQSDSRHGSTFEPGTVTAVGSFANAC